MGIRIVKDGISKSELIRMAENQFGDYLKAVVDADRMVSGSTFYGLDNYFFGFALAARLKR